MKNYKSCTRCKNTFDESEMDLQNGKWICNDCEMELLDDEEDEE